MMDKIKIISYLLAVFIVVGCKQDNSTSLYQEANAFCALFSPDIWSEMRKNYQGAKLMQEFTRRVDEVVSSKELESIMDKQHELPKDPDVLYKHYTTEVSALSGQPFSCPNLKLYFEETLK